MDVRCFPADDREGRDVLVVIAKMTWSLSPQGAATIARPISPVRLFDVPRLGGDHPSLRYANDGVDEKPGTDVLLLGTAHPSHPDATEQSVSLRVETGHDSLHKVLTVHGPRTWQMSLLTGLTPGPAGKLAPTPLTYELAFGGVDATDPDALLVDFRNPSGSGFLERRASLVGRPAPVIEDPRAPISSRNPAVAGFGPIPAHWQPRSARMGTLDDAWRRERAPLRPLDFDPRHNSCAPEGQWLETPLQGDEAVEILGVRPEGPVRFRLPRYAPVFHATRRGETFEYETHLDTFLVDTDQRRVELCWRTRIPLPRKTEHLEKVVVFGSESLPEAVVTDLAARVFGGDRATEAP